MQKSANFWLTTTNSTIICKEEIVMLYKPKSAISVSGRNELLFRTDFLFVMRELSLQAKDYLMSAL